MAQRAATLSEGPPPQHGPPTRAQWNWGKLADHVKKVRAEVDETAGSQSPLGAFSATYSNPELTEGWDETRLRTKFGATLQRRVDGDDTRGKGIYQYPAPEVYNHPAEMRSWKAKMTKGGGVHAFFTPKTLGKIYSIFEGWGRNNNFVGSKHDADENIRRAGAAAKHDPSAAIASLDKSYGLGGYWNEEEKRDQAHTMYAHFIPGPDTESLGVSQPSGSADGAYQKEWVAGGYTKVNRSEGTGGAVEGVIEAQRTETLEKSHAGGRIETHRIDFSPKGQGARERISFSRAKFFGRRHIFKTKGTKQ